jgi:hypothetical protein
MTLPVSGAISFNAINVELGTAGTTTANINQASYRTLAGVPSGQISLSNFYGKSNRVTASATIASNTANYNLNTAKATGYSAGKTDMTLTINSGVIVYSTSVGSYALTVDSSWTAGDTVTIINNGTILGCGGNGGSATNTGGTAGTSAGPALLIQRSTSINNGSGRIAGGGGGGGGGGYGYSVVGKSSFNASGGGGGGGIGGGSGGAAAGSYGGSPGVAGTITSAGAGGAYGSNAGQAFGGQGGAGGGYGSAGLAGGSGNPNLYGGGSGGGAGACVSGNASITWIATGIRDGSIS